MMQMVELKSYVQRQSATNFLLEGVCVFYVIRTRYSTSLIHHFYNHATFEYLTACFSFFCSCQIKGISTFVVNLFKAGLKVCNPMVTGHWMQQYCHGQQHEIYPIILPPCFYVHQLFFDEVVPRWLWKLSIPRTC